MKDLTKIHNPLERPIDAKMKLVFIKGFGTSVTTIHGWWDNTFKRWYRRDDKTEIKNPKGWSHLNEWPEHNGKD